MASFRAGRPAWFLTVVVVLALWNLMGVVACIQQIRLGAEAMGPATDYDRALFASLPGWYNLVYAIAVGAGLAGTVALAIGYAVARPLLLVSLVAAAVQFGYMFAATDIIAVKGVWVVHFPLLIIAICLIQYWLALVAARRGWSA